VAKRVRSQKPASFGEREAVTLLARTFARSQRVGAEIDVGIGDDAAVLRARGSQLLVWTSDACVEGVHFDRRWLGLDDIGFRSFQAALSDLAAMGAEPIAALSNLILPAGFSEKELGRLSRGQAAAARSTRCPIVGGNLSRGGELSITTTALGRCTAPLLRSSARLGDELWLVGDVGLARAGLEILRRNLPASSGYRARCVAAWRRPRALIAQGSRLCGKAHAALDVSDGLSGDAARIAEASRVRIVIEEPALLRSFAPELGRAAALLGVSALELALYGGEDYALLATGARAQRPRAAKRIGRVERGRGVGLERLPGEKLHELGAGFDHLTAQSRGGREARARAPR
jgi:thiamine-monophosphate kinase